MIRTVSQTFERTPSCHRSLEVTQQPHRMSQSWADHYPASCVRASKSTRRVCARPSTDRTAHSAAPLEPLLFTSEVRGVADVHSAHASRTTATSACSESPWMISWACPTYRANAGRLRHASGSLLTLLFKNDCNHWFVHGVDGCENGNHGRLFLSLQEAVVALDDWCAWWNS